MAETIDVTVPCVKLKKIPNIPSINILGMVELKGFLDFSLGTPRDCTLAINLMLQLAPLLASMSCLLKILAVIKALEDTVKSAFTKTGDLLDKIGELASECFGILNPLNIAITIKGILELIITFMSCFLEQLDSLLTFQANIDLKAADGNPVLRTSLECARDNAQTSIDNLMLSLEAIQPLLDMATSVARVVGIDLKLPALSDISTQQEHAQVIINLKQAVTTMQEAIKALPL
jgi:hypothetical protein